MANLEKIIEELTKEESFDINLIKDIINIEIKYDEDTQDVKGKRQSLIREKVDEALGL